jgi:hypothetical protein
MAAAASSPLADAAGLPDSTAAAVTTVASVAVDTIPARVRVRLAAAGSAPRWRNCRYAWRLAVPGPIIGTAVLMALAV